MLRSPNSILLGDMERASERKGDEKENGHETMGLVAMGACMG